MLLCFFFFFFQAEDGIRDYKVTGVQTCALPICLSQYSPLLQTGAAGTRPDCPADRLLLPPVHLRADRKSTRLNSSHLVISYAVFCLKKKIEHPFRTEGSIVTLHP